jgi:hypothetical protein
VTVLNQIDQQIEDLWVESDELGFTPQFAPREYEAEIAP